MTPNQITILIATTLFYRNILVKTYNLIFIEIINDIILMVKTYSMLEYLFLFNEHDL